MKRARVTPRRIPVKKPKKVVVVEDVSDIDDAPSSPVLVKKVVNRSKGKGVGKSTITALKAKLAKFEESRKTTIADTTDDETDEEPEEEEEEVNTNNKRKHGGPIAEYSD